MSVDEIIVDLDGLDLRSHEKKELAKLAHMNLHTAIVDAVLSELTESDKKVFLEHLASEENEKIWVHLNEKVEKIEEKIITAAEQMKRELKADIKKVRKS